MIRHTFLLILRNFRRFRSSFFINLIGLSTGLASALLIYLWVMDERATDRFHANEGRLFQVMANHHNSDRVETMEATPDPLALALAREIPEVSHSVNLAPASWFSKFTLAVEGSATRIKASGQFVDSAYLNVFSFPLVQGNPRTALADPKAVLITEQLAVNLFGNTEKAIGQTVDWNISQFKGRGVVTGVMKDIPSASTQRFDFLLTMEAFRAIAGRDENWGNNGPSTFVVLHEGSDALSTSLKIADFIKRKKPGIHVDLFLRPYSSGYLHGRYDNGALAGGRIEYVRLFSVIAAFILLIACINFMNLSTAKASRRIKEVGIKKAVGAGRHLLILQYLGESMLMSFLSLITALILTQLALPSFDLLTGKTLHLEFTPQLTLSLILITLLTGLLAGSYPALYLSGFSPAKVLKGKFAASLGEQWARKGLVVFQFALSVIFIVAVIVVTQQISFVQSKHLGFNKDHVILFDKEGAIADHQDAFLEEIRTIPGVLASSSINQNIVGTDGFTVGVSWPGKNEEEVVQFGTTGVDYGLMETLGFELVEGRNFSREFNDKNSIILNEAAVAIMGLPDPIGRKIIFWGREVEVIGVVRDFHYESLHEKLKPFIFRLETSQTLYIVAKLEAGREQEALTQLEKVYARVNPGFPFSYKFLDEDFQRLYQSEQRVAVLSKYFAGLAILISCLGLFGLAAFTAERRRKEIGLRKVLGSTEAGIVYLLSADFTKIVLLAVVIALPMAFGLCSYWLDSFAYHVGLEAWYFVVAGLAALGIAWLTVGTQAFRAARVNPTECLKEE